MDGVLVDGEPLHFRAFNRMLGEEGKSISLERHKASMGTKGSWPELVAEFQLSQPVEYYSPRYDAVILEEYAACSVALPGAAHVVRTLASERVPLAVASSSRRNWVETCLDRIGLIDAFDVIVTGSDVEHGKPSPEIYLLTASRLGVDPANCLVIEDAPAGIQSAHAAGMTCWAVRTEYTRGLALPNPAREMESLHEMDLAGITGVPA